MQYIVGTAPVEIPRSGRVRPMIQNLGPGKLYFDSDTTVTTTSGIQLDVGDVLEIASPSAHESGLFIVADAEGTDVRVVLMEDD